MFKRVTHNGFPVVDYPMHSTYNNRTFGKLRGLILRSELIVMLQHQIFRLVYLT